MQANLVEDVTLFNYKLFDPNKEDHDVSTLTS
ncbi:MAG: hypothetical protein SP1CHLAM54_13280 [Chlamydiia bacterium]|nr:hypothetical protein [Chlamydiia bacterium]MCH9616224.1 hypothetical protein [Chlamydiia bacterium]MCH9629790.1 hypothetical protein [Chlamydiia bacterium]